MRPMSEAITGDIAIPVTELPFLRMGLKKEECIITDDGLDEVVSVFADTTGIRDLEQVETIEGMQAGDLFSPFLRMHKDGFGTEEYHGEWNIFDCIFVNGALANPSDGSLRIQKSDDVHYGYIFNPPFLVQQDGPYAGTPFRTFSGGQFIEGYSGHYPTYIIVSKQ